MAGYSTSTPPVLISQAVGGGYATWRYNSVDNATTVDVPGYFTNAKELGIAVGDLIIVTDTDASPPIVTTHRAVSYSGDTLTISTGDTTVTGTSGS
jgi:hypothetical protein